jgi:branched-chain amino acid transport system substrate-binding protein
MATIEGGHRMKKGIALALALLATAVVAATAHGGPTAAGTSQAVSCDGTLKIAIVTPLTGGAGPIGNQQLQWAKYGVAKLAPKYKLKVQLLTGDTPVEKGPGESVKVSQKFIADPNVVAVLGPATSGGVASASKALTKAGIVHISPSATDTALAAGPKAKRTATTAFFRVVGGDYIQGPSDAKYMVDRLKVKKVVLVDFQEPYSVGLASAAQAYLKQKGVTTVRQSTSVNTTDFSSLVTNVPEDTDVVFFPTQQPEDAQTFGEQLLEQGKRAKMFGGDGTNNPDAFKLPGSYVSNFAPDITGFAQNKALIAGFKKMFPNATLGSFGPPTYLATEVALSAIRKACNAGNGQIAKRADVIRYVRSVTVPKSILGGSFRFSKQTNEPEGAKFYIFQIQKNGSYKLVG